MTTGFKLLVAVAIFLWTLVITYALMVVLL